MKRIENKCTNCKFRGPRCKASGGVVVWLHCNSFSPSTKAMEKAEARRKA